jgi:anthranilate synthase component 2
VDVYRNDQIPLENIDVYDKIILSPGRGCLLKLVYYCR